MHRLRGLWSRLDPEVLRKVHEDDVAGIADDPKFGGIENLGVAPVPAGSAGQGAPVGGHNYVVWSGMDEAKADAAIAFINFMSSAESEAYIADELGLLPGNADAYDLSLIHI